MLDKKKLVWHAVLVGTILVAGCAMFDKNEHTTRPTKVEKTIAERQKTELLRAIDNDFDNAQAHYDLGKLYEADGLRSKAEYEYNTTLGFDPVHRRAQAALVKILMTAGDEAKSKIYADMYMNQASAAASASLQLALAFQKEELDEYALGCYRQALHMAPNSARINRQIGYYYLSKGDKVQAKDYLIRSFQLDPKDAEVAGQLGRLGVMVKIPEKTQKNTKSLDKMVDVDRVEEN